MEKNGERDEIEIREKAKHFSKPNADLKIK